MKKTLVSIIIPVFGRIEFFKLTLESIKMQTYSNWECIIVDDGSEKEELEIIKALISQDSRISLLLRPEHKRKGANACRNIGIERAKGDFLVFLDSDDVLASFCLEDRLKTIEKFPSRDFYVFNMAYLNNPDVLVNKYHNSKQENYLAQFLSNSPAWPITSLLVSNNVKVTFDEGLKRFQDVDYSIKLILGRLQYHLFKDITPDCYYRVTEDSLSRVNNKGFIKKVVKSYCRLLNNVFKYGDNFLTKDELRKSVKRGYIDVFKTFILPHKKWMLFLSMLRVSFKFNILDFYSYYNLLMIMIYQSIGVQNVKGIGYHRISKIIRN
ncbi:glycosyltransferase family 2 protein [Urechidicola vernalis]|uniref:Glycosyltransferase family 2 protein n=1 Tax=Urechidicola vernalis TaxID=3075600 RepID=A0ABU2Y240_9FLAO|nr:glycosyltransferase family 2 protein [Urechidicola sp. P050]MDT0552273.1 glycosyltransferase family 2 protein [Urechidicola sp. P050]